MSREEPYYIPMPEEYGRRRLNALYREIPLKDTTSRLLRKYFNAAANLYGIIPLRKLYGIITSQNKSLVTKEEFLAFAEIARHECEDYYILGKSELYYDGPDTDLMDIEATIYCERESHKGIIIGKKGASLKRISTHIMKSCEDIRESPTIYQARRSFLLTKIPSTVRIPRKRLRSETFSCPKPHCRKT